MTPVSRLAALALALAAAPPSQASADEARRAAPVAPLVSFLTADDYPAEAVRNGEQGSVAFRLSIGPDGRVNGCAVTSSSGSTLLDSTTCRLMSARVRFRPATDAQGKPRPDDFEGRIVWRLPESQPERIDLPERPGAAMELWSRCAWGEAARLALSTLEPADVADRALAACAALEARAGRELGASGVVGRDVPTILQAFKEDFSVMLASNLERARRILAEPQGK